MKKKKKKGDKFKIFIALIMIIIALYIIYNMIFPTKKKEKPIIEEVKVIDKIEAYDYVLEENEMEYYKSLFQELSNVLMSEEKNEEEYAILISKLFISDFFTLDNKVTKNDIGGLQFVHEEEQEDFINKAKNTVYKYLESNIYEDRNQDLPMVKNIEVIETTTISYKYGNKTDKDAYKITLKIGYEQDLEYQTDAILYLVHEDDKLKIVEMKEK